MVTHRAVAILISVLAVTGVAAPTTRPNTTTRPVFTYPPETYADLAAPLRVQRLQNDLAVVKTYIEDRTQEDLRQVSGTYAVVWQDYQGLQKETDAFDGNTPIDKRISTAQRKLAARDKLNEIVRDATAHDAELADAQRVADALRVALGKASGENAAAAAAASSPRSSPEQSQVLDRGPYYPPPPSRASASSSDKTVHVRGYTRKDGTYVQPYDRRPPSRKR